MSKKAAKVEDIEQFAELALNGTHDAIIVTNLEHQIEWLNRGFEQMFGYPANQCLGKRPGEFLDGEETDKALREKVERAVSNREKMTTEILHYHADGTPVWVEKTLSPVFDTNGTHTHNMSISRDITKRRKLEEHSREVMENEDHRQHERKLLSQISEWLYSAKSLDELLKVVQRSMQTLLPEADGQLFIYSNSRDTLDLMAHWGTNEPHMHIDAEDCWALRRGRAYSFGTKAIEFACSHVESETIPYFCLPIIAHGETIGLLHLSFSAFDSDIVPREVAETFLNQRWELGLLCAEQISLAVANVQLRQELLDQSIRDPLTSLWNRRWFLDAAHKEIKRAERGDSPLSLISIDVDHFKKFNDHHGHDAGDIVLREVGVLMRAMFQTPLAPCRLGGEEFVALCPGLTHEECMSLANEFRIRISELDIVYGDGNLPRINISAGVVSYPDGGKQVIDIVKQADLALYRAKEQGRNCVVSARTLSEKVAAE